MMTQIQKTATRGMFALIMFAISIGFLAAGKQDFTLVNDTGYTIDRVYVAPTRQTDWQEDILGKDVLEDGESQLITFDRSETTCSWDVKVVYDDGEEAIWIKLNLCEIEALTIHWNKKSGETTATVE
jgi:hypothetical protein